ncbi:hypothetical protein TNCV_3620541, partial [Trichonephila clavipes]
MPWEKKKVLQSYPQEDNDPSLECGPDLLDRTGDIDWAEDEMTSQTEGEKMLSHDNLKFE